MMWKQRYPETFSPLTGVVPAGYDDISGVVPTGYGGGNNDTQKPCADLPV